jgi:hypothetical protein
MVPPLVPFALAVCPYFPARGPWIALFLLPPSFGGIGDKYTFVLNRLASMNWNIISDFYLSTDIPLSYSTSRNHTPFYFSWTLAVNTNVNLRSHF